MEGKERLLQNPSGNFLLLLDALWKWRSEEEFISRKLELLEARLYRVSEELFPEWEQWRMADRAQEIKDYLLFASGKLCNSLTGAMETQWANEYIQAFTHKYLFRIDNVLKSLTPLFPRPPETLVKIGTDYG